MSAEKKNKGLVASAVALVCALGWRAYAASDMRCSLGTT